jgi:hypothetical protein
VENLRAVGLRNKMAAMHEVWMLTKTGSCLQRTDAAAERQQARVLVAQSH